MSIYHIPVRTIEGEETTLAPFKGRALLVVNVASKCGFTPQYEALQRLYERYEPLGFTVLGFPCNQFGSQEPGEREEIKSFCSTTYRVTFPLFDKIEVNGPNRHPLYAELTQHPDASGQAGDVMWNFEKFLVSPDGDVVARFRTTTAPDADEVVRAIEAALPSP